MTTQTEALTLALEALEGVLDDSPKVLEASISGGLYEVIQCREAITAIKEALAQPEQEPVATLDDLEQEIYENTRQFVSSDVMEWMLKRYYTTPPQRTWVGLTDEEFQYCVELKNPESIAEEVEAKLKEKNT